MRALLRLAACLFAAALAAPAVAGPASPPLPTGGEPELLVDGRLRAPQQPVRLGMAALEQLPQRSFTATTPWYQRPVTFSGPLLRDVLALARADGSRLRAVALNEYQVVIPVEDARRHDVIVAIRLDGRPMSVREKGPFFVVYPFDEDAQLRQATYYARSIWQLRRLTVE